MIIKLIGDKYIAESQYIEKDILKEAGFRWDPADKVWWTNSLDIASRF